nr:ankyrin repeat-containing protein At5g02620 [Arachis hypogaea]
MENPFEAFTGMAGEEPTHGPDELSFFDPDEDIFKDIVGRNIENSPKPENPSDTRGGAPTDQNDSKEGTKSGDLVLKCCDCVISNVKNTEDCERMKPMRPQLLMKCGCGRADCKSNIAAAIAVADHSTEDASDDDSKKETPYLLAAKHGIIEMVTMIQQKIPSVIHTTNSKNQNVLLVAVKNRQPQVVLELKKKSEAEVWDNLVIGVDDDDNTLLHLAAHGLKGDKSWQIAGSALQMMWDIKWYQYMKKIVPRHCHFRSNKDSKTAGQIFNTSHQELIQEASQWLKDTSESCSVVAALVAGVSFATAGNVPGGYDNGEPPLEGQPAFEVFALASLVGLCFSVTGLIMFLSILTSRKVAKDFRRSLPLKLLAGLSSLFVSIITMFVSFCSGHFFLVNHKYKSILFPLYAATSIPVAFYALAQFPLYFDLLRAILTTVPTASDVGEIL